MHVFKKKQDLTEALQKRRNEGEKIGLVPTMGALHEGHLTLIRTALTENDLVVVSIFVNPTQFDNKNDLEKYPQTLEKDLSAIRGLDEGIMVFVPTAEEMYSENIVATSYDFDGLEQQMEGKFRTGHFDGVGTIVKKLFETVAPDRAYFGEKDFQQLQIIKKLVSKYHIPVEVRACPISREDNGLARSSRNERLSPELRDSASFIYNTLLQARDMFGTKSADNVKVWVEKRFESHPLFDLEYIEIADENTLESVKNMENNKKYRLFIAVYANDIRLIDNIALN